MLAMEPIYTRGFLTYFNQNCCDLVFITAMSRRQMDKEREEYY